MPNHLEHPEDQILTGDLSVLDFFVTPGHLSVKIDGAPSVGFGVNPATGKFAVATKSFLNKKKIKIAHSHEEIDAFYQGEVAKILHHLFDYAPRQHSVWIQADWIGFGGDTEYTPLVVEDIDGNPTEFKPIYPIQRVFDKIENNSFVVNGHPSYYYWDYFVKSEMIKWEIL